MSHSADSDAPLHPHVVAVRAYLDNAGITPETLRYAATHEALCRSWIFDLLTGLADVMEAETRDTPPAEGRPVQGCMACATYRSEGRACPEHRVTSPEVGLPDCEGWICQSCGADNFIPDGFVRGKS